MATYRKINLAEISKHKFKYPVMVLAPPAAGMLLKEFSACGPYSSACTRCLDSAHKAHDLDALRAELDAQSRPDEVTLWGFEQIPVQVTRPEK